jgi:3-methylcrotonyl-CoA carboxylase alpha subunit
VIKSLLIANRGEIACRIIATARRLGIRTIAVHSDADSGARHVRLAGESHCIGPPAATESYLRGDRVIEAAIRAGADAVHPGYGFLSENADFARACSDAGLVFVGPAPEVIRTMASKRIAKDVMETAGVPVTPDYRGEDQTVDIFLRQAKLLGYPVMLKPAQGGGGMGMRRVDHERDLPDALTAAKREAKAAFGDEEILAEKYVQTPRHIEVQVFGDSHGNVVHLFERDCTLQRRHQKIIEEAPATLVPLSVRESLRAAAIRAATSVRYTNAGTVEFMVEESGAFHFMEMNTRLQVEHPVTEAITGLDLVEWQLRVAAGEALPLSQAEISADGHAMEARVYAESPDTGFLPSPGRIQRLSLDSGGDYRVDRGVDQNDEVTRHYDPMIAKLIVHGADRESARRGLLDRVLAARINGLSSNLAFLATLLSRAEFKAGNLDIQFVDRVLDQLVAGDGTPQVQAIVAAVLAWSQAPQAGEPPGDPWRDTHGWRLNLSARRMFHIEGQDGTATAVLEDAAPTQLSWAGQTLFLDDAVVQGNHVAFSLTGHRHEMIVVEGSSAFHVIADDGVTRIVKGNPFNSRSADAASDGNIVAPMPGKITSVLVAVGQKVASGDRLAIIEAMKMEHVLRAANDGVVVEIHGNSGDFVAEGATIVRLGPAATQ